MNEMQAFWQRQHINKDQLFLSGNGQVTTEILQIKGEIFDSAQTMLNVGIGLAVFEDYCLSVGKIIDCLDIAPAARDRVIDRVRQVYLDPNELPSAEYDLITELLVAQHLDDPTLESHLSNCLRALKPDGIYAIQLPAFFDPAEADLANMVHAMESGSVCRSISWVDDLARKHHGQIIHIGWRGNFPQYNSIWYIYHLKRLCHARIDHS